MDAGGVAVVTQVLGVMFAGPGMVARDALVPRVARQDDVPLARATTLQETLQNTALFVGPLAAGLLIAGLERQRPVHDHPLTPAGALADVRDGFRFARDSAGALGLFLGAQALGGVLGGLIFAAVGPRLSRFWWFVVIVASFALVPAMRLVGAPGPEPATGP